jgi:hypothetical protein
MASFFSLKLQFEETAKYYGHFTSVEESLVTAKSFSMIPSLKELIALPEVLPSGTSVIITEENISKTTTPLRAVTVSLKSLGYLFGASFKTWVIMTPIEIIQDSSISASGLKPCNEVLECSSEAVPKVEETQPEEKIQIEEEKKIIRPVVNEKYAQSYQMVQDEMAKALKIKFGNTLVGEENDGSQIQAKVEQETILTKDAYLDQSEIDSQKVYVYKFTLGHYYSAEKASELCSFLLSEFSGLSYKTVREVQGESHIFKIVLWVNDNDLVPLQETDIDRIHAFIIDQNVNILFRGPQHLED